MRLITVFFVMFSLAGSAFAQQSVPNDIIKAGEADFQTYCAVCHGRDGKGNGPVAKDLITTPSDLTTLAKRSGGEMFESIIHRVIDGRQDITAHGPRDMPIWGNWFKFMARAGNPENTDDETAEIIAALRIQGLIEYMKTIQEK